MTAAYCSYCDAETEGGQGAVCASCGRGRGALFPAVLTPEQVDEYRKAPEGAAWRDLYLQRPEPRGGGPTVLVRMFGYAVDDVTAGQRFTDLELPAHFETGMMRRQSARLTPDDMDGWTFRAVVGKLPEWHGFRDQ